MGKLFLSSVVLILGLNTLVQGASWRGITPLHSTRADVEQRLGKPNGKYGRYEFENEEAEIRYSTGNCANGWDVSDGTVLDIAVFPKQEVRLSDLRIDLGK